MLRLDHLAVSCGTLAAGVAHVEAVLGVPLAPGGQHAHMGTHNRLLAVGDIYLEVIAVVPAAPAPGWQRWFDLDRFQGAPRLTNWVVACENIKDEVALGPPGIGVPVTLERGDLRWQMAVPADGRLPFDGAFPALISWQGTAHPVQRLPDGGIRLAMLEVIHPDADALQAALAGRLADPRVRFTPGPAKALRASFDTPGGTRRL